MSKNYISIWINIMTRVISVSIESWSEFSIKDICINISSGGTPSRKVPEYYLNGVHKWIKTQELKDCNIYDTDEHITDAALKNSSAKIYPKNTISMAMYGATVGKLGIMKSECATNQACCNMVVDSTKADYRFLFYSLLYRREELIGLASGAAQQNLNVGVISNFRINLPTLSEQKAIAATLSVLDDMIELNNQINKTLEEMAQAIFKSWFVDFEPFKDGESEESEIGLIPKGWKIVELEEICSIQNGFAFKSSDYQDTGCRLIRTTNITSNGYVNNNDIKFLPQSFYESEKYKNYRFECFDTVLVMVGASIGKIGLITEYNLPSLQNQNMWRFRANNREISSVYIHYVVRRVNEFVSNWATGSARDFYRKESFQRAKCVLPPKNVMKEFRLLTDSLFIQISSNIMENALLLEIRDILLPKLMSGEIRVPVEEVV